MSWDNPRWGSLMGPDANVLRNIFQSLKDFLQNPTFGRGITITADPDPTYDPVTDVRLDLKPRRIEISTDGDANFVKTYAPTTSNVDPYEPGRFFSVVTASDIGQTYIRPPYAASTSGQPYFGLESGVAGDPTLGKITLGFVQPSTGLGPELRMTYGQTTLFGSNLTVFGTLSVGVGHIMRATAFEDTGAGPAPLRMASGNILTTSWDGTNLHFFVDGTLVKTI